MDAAEAADVETAKAGAIEEADAADAADAAITRAKVNVDANVGAVVRLGEVSHRR